MLSTRIPNSLKERLDEAAAAARLSLREIVIAAITAELDALDAELAERAVIENMLRAQRKGERIDSHTRSSTRGKTGSAKRIPKSS